MTALYIVFALIGLGLILLGREYGIAVTQVWTCRKYRESFGGRSASFAFCNGYTRRVLRLPKGKRVRLTLETELTRGDVHVEILSMKRKGCFAWAGRTPRARCPAEGICTRRSMTAPAATSGCIFRKPDKRNPCRIRQGFFFRCGLCTGNMHRADTFLPVFSLYDTNFHLHKRGKE